MEAHSLAERYPLMGEDEFATFKADIKANGCREPIRTYEGKILDGRNRYRACREVGIDPLMWEFGGTEEEASAAVDSWNLHRRHLTQEFRNADWAKRNASGESKRAIAAKDGVGEKTVREGIAKSQVRGNPAPETTSMVTDATQDEPGERAKEAQKRHTEGNKTGGGAHHGSGIPTGRGSAGQVLGADGDTNRHTPKGAGQRVPVKPPEPPKVTGRDGKKYPATKPRKAAESGPEPESKAFESKPARVRQTDLPSPALTRAEEAINLLMRIARDDPRRDEALRMVKLWIHHNSDVTSKKTTDELCAEFLRMLNFVEFLKIPDPEDDPFKLVDAMEKTGRSMLRRAREFRRKQHLS